MYPTQRYTGLLSSQHGLSSDCWRVEDIGSRELCRVDVIWRVYQGESWWAPIRRVFLGLEFGRVNESSL